MAMMGVFGCKGKAPAPLGVGARFPNLSLTNLLGQKVGFPDVLQATMTLISIRTIGCRFCASDFAELEKLYQTYTRDELDITVINVGVESATVQDFLRGKYISFSILIDQQMESMHKTHSVILPVMYLVDRHQTICYRLAGGFSAEEISSLIRTGFGDEAAID